MQLQIPLWNCANYNSTPIWTADENNIPVQMRMRKYFWILDERLATFLYIILCRIYGTRKIVQFINEFANSFIRILTDLPMRPVLNVKHIHRVVLGLCSLWDLKTSKCGKDMLNDTMPRFNIEIILLLCRSNARVSHP